MFKIALARESGSVAIGREGSQNVVRYVAVYGAAVEIANAFEAHQHELWLCAGGRGQRKAEHITLPTMALRRHNGPFPIVFADGRQTVFIQKLPEVVGVLGAAAV